MFRSSHYLMSNIILACSQFNSACLYALYLVDLMTKLGHRVHIVENDNFHQQTVHKYQELPLDYKTIFGSNAVIKSYALKNHDQDTIQTLIRDINCRLFIYVCKDNEQIFKVDKRFSCVSLLVMLLSYDTVPPVTRDIMPFFDFYVASGHHSYSKLLAIDAKKTLKCIFPRFKKALPEAINQEHIRSQLGIDQRKFVYLVDMNSEPQLKGIDIIVSAYGKLLQEEPDIADKVLLLLNAHPDNVHLQNILARQNLPDHCVRKYGDYYAKGGLEDIHLHALISVANVFVSTCCGTDFDAHVFLAQSYKKPVIYNNVMHADKHIMFGLKVTENQRWWNPPAQAPLYLPSINQVSQLMLYSYRNLHNLKASSAVVQKIQDFQAKHDKFDEMWPRILHDISSGYNLR